jgi:hypothetical protein
MSASGGYEPNDPPQADPPRNISLELFFIFNSLELMSAFGGYEPNDPPQADPSRNISLELFFTLPFSNRCPPQADISPTINLTKYI